MIKPNPSSEVPDDLQRQQCMLYLLSELDAEQTSAFELQLHNSPELGDELRRQANVISALSQSPPRTTLTPATSMTRWQIAASVIMAVSACLALVVFGVQPGTPDSVASLAGKHHLSPGREDLSEDLLIARAWADTHHVNSTDDFSFSEPEDAFVTPVNDPSDMDSTLSWMFIAVSANIDSQSLEESNDG